MNTPRRIGLMGLLLVPLVAAGACGSSPSAPGDAPEGHTIVRGGVAHASGFRNPTQDCVGCHGVDLRGGEGGEPSCYSCHGQIW